MWFIDEHVVDAILHITVRQRHVKIRSGGEHIGISKKMKPSKKSSIRVHIAIITLLLMSLPF